METFTPGSPRPQPRPGHGKLRYYASARQGASLAQLLQSVRMAPGVIVLHGPSGSGKSLLCERLARALEGQPFEPLSISSHLAHSIDLVNTLCDSLGLERSASAIVDRLVQPANPLVLMLDHADDINDVVLGDALTLLASRDVVNPSLRLVLVGSEALVQRTEALCPPGVSRRSVALGTLRREDLRPYLLFIHGDDEDAVRLFDGADARVYARIATRTACLPGAINTLAATLLAEAATSPVDALTTQMVDELSAEHLQGEWRRPGGSAPDGAQPRTSDEAPPSTPPLLAPVARAAAPYAESAIGGNTNTDDVLENTIFARPKSDGAPTDLAPVRATPHETPRPSRVLEAGELRAARRPATHREPRPDAPRGASRSAARPAELPLPEPSAVPEEAPEPASASGERSTFGMVMRYAALAVGGLAIFVGLTGSPMIDSLLDRLKGESTPPPGVASDASNDSSAVASPSPILPAPGQQAPQPDQPARTDAARGSITRSEQPAPARSDAVVADGGAIADPPASTADATTLASSSGEGVLGRNPSSGVNGSALDDGGSTGTDDGASSTGNDINARASGASDAIDRDTASTDGREATGGAQTHTGPATDPTVTANKTLADDTDGAAETPPGSDQPQGAAGDGNAPVADGTPGAAPPVPSAGTGTSAGLSTPGVATTAIEDEAVSLAIALPRTSSGDVLDLIGLPVGSAIAGGARTDEGRWQLQAAAVNAVAITPPANFAGSFDVVATLRRTSDGSSTTANYPVNIEPVADPPRLDVRASPGDVNSALPLEVRAGLADGDGSERLSITLRDLPETVQVSAGTRQADGSWRLSRSDLKGLYLTPLPGTPELLRFTVVATALEQSNNATAEVARSIEIRVVPDR